MKLALCAGVAFSALWCASLPASAQDAINPLGATVAVPADAQLFLEADTVTYESDSDSGIVTASGGVQIDYGGYKLVTREVVYNQKTRRLVAKGDVELLQPDGSKVYADSADITDDFADGFVTALRIETVENTRFAAAGAVREEGNVTTFEQGVYTACEACREHPERAPLWQVKARKIVWDQKEKVVRYYGAKFELYGLPLAYLPYFQAADPTVKRKSGFLVPSLKQSSELGTGVRVPYFIAISDSMDATVAGTYYSNQGFLGEVEFRQATENGYYTIQAAGISQSDPEAFGVNTPDYGRDTRGMIGTTGQFALSEQWTFGWDILAQTDKNFANTYDIENFNQTYHTSEIYLTGLGDRSFFDLRAQRFDNQSDDRIDQDVQPDVFPSLDYERIEEGPFGGEVEIDVNAAHLDRKLADTRAANFLLCEPRFIVKGSCSSTAASAVGRTFPYRDDFFRRQALEGNYSRGTAEAEWRRTLTTDEGLVLTPSLGLRGDAYRADMSNPGFVFPSDIALGRTSSQTLGGITVDEAGFKGMATAALEARYPVVIETANSSHIIEPIAQFLVRPNEMDAGLLPNEDAQSLVFDASNLFSKDKFSGYDRVEGGTRANVGLRYAGTFEGGYALDAMVGQSYHLAGENPFQNADLALVGYDSGLESDRSDYVSSLAFTMPVGLQLGVQGRFDEETLEVRRTDLSANYGFSRGNVGVIYSFIGEQPIYGFQDDRSQIGTSASLKLNENWTAFGSLGYDLKNETMISRSLGLQYLDECFSIMASYQSTEDTYRINDAQNTLLFKIGLRTIADFDYSYDLDEK
ncbi:MULTISPECIES: LPS-assembly protein LptD [unclassified Aureimonas]|uniref:LPS-assembly protein LptD n=1 Tax=unclassified Aureimonas TaxID=2615206 RepID=UPI001FCDB3D0|nr:MULTISPECIES: LPS-assembly protein LptD [unclassified Aureimonas]